MEEKAVIIVGSGPSGLATAACLNQYSIPYTILEREDCFASIWQKYAYDRLHLHLDKHICQLPHMPFPPSYPNYVPKDLFIQYLNNYVSRFDIKPLYNRSVVSAHFDESTHRWIVKATNINHEDEYYTARFLVVASGESSDPFIPRIDELSTSTAHVIHSTRYKNGKSYKGKNVLVVGSGNSGMEIALDLANHGANTSIVVRSPVHVMTRGMAYLGLSLMKYFAVEVVDSLMVILSKIVYGDLSKYGLTRPEKEGPFYMKYAYGKYPVVDVGTCSKIKAGQIQVLAAIDSIRGNEVSLNNGKSYSFDTIIFCTGFKRSTDKWLKEDEMLNKDGLPKQRYPNHWKGKKGLYCVGLSRNGLPGASADAQNIARDINNFMSFDA